MKPKIAVPVALGLVAVAGAAVWFVADSGAEPAPLAGSAPTADVAVRDLTRTEKLSGTVAYQDMRDLSAAQSGIITQLPTPGTDLVSGDVLMRINDKPVVLLNGVVPAWRDLKSGVTDGPDVHQLESALLALGFGKPSATYPDDDWSQKTTDAVKQLQKKIGAEDDGVLSLGEVVFTEGNVHIAKLNAHEGGMTSPSAPVLTVQSTDRVVSVDLDPLDRDLIEVGKPVQVELPSGDKAAGKVESVSTTLESNSDGKGVFKVTISLDSPDQVSGLALAPVTVHYVATVAQQALSVPVSSVIGLPGGGNAVVVVGPDGTTKQVPVKLGEWGDGFVQVTGDLPAGTKVEVPL
ncbi:efflux RND transporter periplasmic adaptor subunit [Amycolatopsis sp. YIM 10]|uniref:efflux RND transporter periplasmic adaptor subunit n=1 Tax=Amycolatopsis sp. YIM 10 TaxID=2653857 RepID=UPI001290501E|nr:HlyD family efflux transporter periplasmic adaptor subunit [Amycolatopsis sp. YIM 10]QFU93212.1 HlyD family secretion protein [Amycolatopsis sp. YIM 10]